jgi:hypothetical protein
MKKFNIYKGTANDLIAVKQGWSWLAFLFGPFWFSTVIEKKVSRKAGCGMGCLSWIVAIVAILIIAGSLGTMADVDPDEGQGFIFLGAIIVGIVFGVWGNRLVGSAVEKNGYEFVSVQDAKNEEEAKNKVLK